MIDILVMILACLGVFLMLTAAIGVVRFRNTYLSLHCAGKSASLGIIFLLAATGFAATDIWVTIRCLLAALFFMITAPLGCHALARVLWRSGYHRQALLKSSSTQVDVLDQQQQDNDADHH